MTNQRIIELQKGIANDLHEDISELSEENERLRAALVLLLNRYVELVNCGDCGNWNPEEETPVIQARAALERTK